MIIVFADDQTVNVLSDIDAVRRECEAVDVDEGVYRFFDEFGRQLIPRWVIPVKRRSIFRSMKSVGTGRFELEVDSQNQDEAFETSIANVVAIEPNAEFESVADLAHYVAENRQR
jgi:hypothetical protein